MVTSTRTASRLMIIARPNQSATWRTNQLVLLAVAVPSLAIASGFALLGAWPILPFAGLELLALGSALYYVNWKLQYRHVITVSNDSVRIDKGFYTPRQSWQFARHGTGLAITPEKHPWEGPELSVHDRNESVTLGEFLSREDVLKLIALLQQEIRVGTHSQLSQRSF
ncbi:MAG: DUF2244 domain-containing protein [Halioglobus sp.]